MITERDGNICLVTQESEDLHGFIASFQSAYSSMNCDNLIINLFSMDGLKPGDLLEFLDISNNHREAGYSFVLVTDQVGYDDLPEELLVVPTVQEAKDLISMEEIERDLDL